MSSLYLGNRDTESVKVWTRYQPKILKDVETVVIIAVESSFSFWLFFQYARNTYSAVRIEQIFKCRAGN